jgi:hypothetical protein
VLVVGGLIEQRVVSRCWGNYGVVKGDDVVVSMNYYAITAIAHVICVFPRQVGNGETAGKIKFLRTG